MIIGLAIWRLAVLWLAFMAAMNTIQVPGPHGLAARIVLACIVLVVGFVALLTDVILRLGNEGG